MLSYLIGFFLGKTSEKRYWRAYVAQHRERISLDNFNRLERKLAISETNLHVAQGGERKLLLALRAARTLNQKVQEILSL